MTIANKTFTAPWDIFPQAAAGQELGHAANLWDLFTREVTFGGGSTANVITVPDNVASGLELVDAGGIEYMRVDTQNAQPQVHWNIAGADIDYRWEAVGVDPALFIRGSDGFVGVGTVPDTPLHVVNGGTDGIEINLVAGSNVNALRMHHTGAIGPNNIEWFHSLRDNNEDYWIFAYNGTIFKNFIQFEWSNGYTGFGRPDPKSNVDIFVNNVGFDATQHLGLSNEGDTANNTYSGVLYATRTAGGQEGKTWVGVEQVLGNGRHDFIWLLDSVADDNTVALVDEKMRLSNAGNLGIQMAPTANGLFCLGTPTENLEFIDAGSAGATEQDWIEVEVGGVQGFIRVFAAV